MASVLTRTHERIPASAKKPRGSARQKIGPLVYIHLGDSNGGFPINVSEEGLSFQGILPLEKDQLLAIRFKLPDLDGSIESGGQIAWVNPIGSGGGLRFVNLTDESRLRIKNWISLENKSNETEPVAQSSVDVKAQVESIVKPQSEKSNTASLVRVDGRNAGSASSTAAKNRESTRKIRKQATAGKGSDSHATPQAKEIANAFPAPASAAPKKSVPASKARILPKGTARRSPYTRVVLMMSGAAVVAIAGAISVKVGPALLLEKIKARFSPPSSEISAMPTAELPATAPIVENFSDKLAPDATVSEPSTDTLVPAAPTDSTSQIEKLGTSDDSSGSATAVSPKSREIAQDIKRRKPPKRSITKVSAPLKAAKTLTAEVAVPFVIPPAASQPDMVLPLGFREPSAPVVSGGSAQPARIEEARLLIHRNPIYPQLAKRNHLSGIVNLVFTIGVDGRPHNIKVIKGSELLTPAALEAVKTWRYEPARRNGVAVESESSTLINFKLD